MKAEKIATEIEKLNKLGILKKAIVIKKGKDEDVVYLADTYIASVNTLADDEIPEDVAKFYNELGDQIDAKTLIEKEEDVVVEVEKKPAKEDKKKETKKSTVKKEVAKEDKKAVVKKTTVAEIVKEKDKKPPVKAAEKKVEKKKEVKKDKKVRTGWKAGSTCDKIHQLIISAGDKGISLESAVTKASKFDSREAYTKQIFGECIRYGLATKKDEKYFSVVKK
jgi:hypothetical protein